MFRALVGSFYTPLDAELARGVLEGADIPSRIEGDQLAGAAQWAQGQANVRLFVADEHAEEAERLLREHEAALAAERRKPDTLDDAATRAYRLAILGWMLLPVVTQAMSAARLARIPYAKLSKPVQRRYLIAMTFNGVVLGSVVLALVQRCA